MASSATPRPLSVTIFGWLVVLGSGFIVISAFEQIAALSSLDTRRQVEEFLAEPPGNGLGLGVESTLDLLHVLGVVTGGCAAAAAVLGVYVLRRSRLARLGLTLVVIPMFVAGLALGGILTALVAAGAVAMWLQPARAWFDGVPPPPPRNPFGGPRDERRASDDRGEDDRGGQGPGPGALPPGGADDDREGDEREDAGRPRREHETVGLGARGRSGPRAYVGFGQPGAGPAGDAPAGSPQTEQQQTEPQHDPQQAGSRPRAYPGVYGEDPGAYFGPRPQGYPAPGEQAPWAPPTAPAAPGSRPASRPPAVLVAAVLTWTTCALVGIVMVATVAALAAAPDFLMEEMRRQNPEIGSQVPESTLVNATIGVGAVIAAWCLAAAVVAVFVVRGRPWARVTLAVSAVVAALGCLVLAVGSMAMLLPSLAAAATAYCLLLRPEVRAWFAAR